MCGSLPLQCFWRGDLLIPRHPTYTHSFTQVNISLTPLIHHRHITSLTLRLRKVPPTVFENSAPARGPAPAPRQSVPKKPRAG